MWLVMGSCQMVIVVEAVSTSQSPTDSCRTQRIPEDSSGLHYNFSDFELEEKISVKSSGIVRTGTEFGRISATLEYIPSLARGHVTWSDLILDRFNQLKLRFIEYIYID